MKTYENKRFETSFSNEYDFKDYHLVDNYLNELGSKGWRTLILKEHKEKYMRDQYTAMESIHIEVWAQREIIDGKG